MRFPLLILVVSIGACIVFGHEARDVAQGPVISMNNTRFGQLIRGFFDGITKEPKKIRQHEGMVQEKKNNFKRIKNDDTYIRPATVVLGLIKVFLEAVKNKNAEVVLKLFNSTEEDKKNIDNFIKTHQGFDIYVVYAKYDKNGGIEADLKLSMKKLNMEIPVQWYLTKNSESPTGWRVNVIRKGSVPQDQLRGFIDVGAIIGGTVVCWINILSCVSQTINDIVSG